MNTTLDERERAAYAANDQVTLAALNHAEKELLDGVPTEDELKDERAAAEAWETLALNLGALAEHMVDADNEQRLTAQTRLADLSRRYGGFINPQTYVAETKTDSVFALAADVGLMADDVHSARRSTK